MRARSAGPGAMDCGMCRGPADQGLDVGPVRVAAVLAALGRVFRVGPTGARHARKAANDLLSSINLAAVAEVMPADEVVPVLVVEHGDAGANRKQAFSRIASSR